MRTCSRDFGFHGRRRAVSAAVLIALLVPLTSCGVKVFGRHLAVPGIAPEPAAAALERKLVDAREQAALAPNEPYWRYREAEVWLEADSVDSGEAALRSALALDPAYAPAIARLARRYYETGRYEQGIALLSPVRAEPARFAAGGRPALLAGLALHYDAIGRPDLAAEAVSGLSTKEKAEAGSALVFLALRSDRPDSAVPLAGPAVLADGRSAANQNNLGIVKLRAGDPVAARRAFLAAIDREPKLAGPYYNLAIVEKFFFLDDGEAAKWFRAYRTRASDDPDSLGAAFRADEPRAVVEKGN